MSLAPLAPWPLLVVLAGLAALLVWWPAGRRERAESLTARARRTAMVGVLLVAALRPGLPGTDVTVDAADLDVYFLADTTTSVMAQDYAGTRPRIEGVRADLKGIAAQLPGARYTLLTFDHQTVTRLPLTSDGAALAAAADTLVAETSAWSQGSSVTVARTALREALERGRKAHPERARLVFYLGDGEQTAPDPPEPFDVDAALVNGGAVLGYGTAEGGAMEQTGTRSGGHVLDPATGQPARSAIDERQLGAIAAQLALPYLHRTSDDGAAAVVDRVGLKELGSLSSGDSTRSVGGRTELSWVLLLALVLLAAWELGAAVAGLSPARRPRTTRAGSSGAAGSSGDPVLAHSEGPAR